MLHKRIANSHTYTYNILYYYIICGTCVFQCLYNIIIYWYNDNNMMYRTNHSILQGSTTLVSKRRARTLYTPLNTKDKIVNTVTRDRCLTTVTIIIFSRVPETHRQSLVINLLL